MIKIENVTLDLPIDRRKTTTSKGSIGGELFVRSGMRFVKALNDVSFEINPGDRVALIGRNGAGKSTLLRTLAGIYQPSSGAVTVDGKISTLFSATLGLYTRDTGRRNIELGGRLLGMSGEEIRDSMENIIEFTELGDFIDVPMAAYSAGMRTRLGFAIATQINPDILLVDEVFGAGDIAFVNKAMSRMEAMMAGANILVLASHSANVLRQCCNKAIWLNQGKLAAIGDIEPVIAQFQEVTNAA